MQYAPDKFGTARIFGRYLLTRAVKVYIYNAINRGFTSIFRPYLGLDIADNRSPRDERFFTPRPLTTLRYPGCLLWLPSGMGMVTNELPFWVVVGKTLQF